MEVLNDDCLYLIFNWLGLSDKCAVAQTNTRFKDIIVTQWRRDYKKVDLCLYRFKITAENFDFFISHIYDVVEVFKLYNMSMEIFEKVTKYVFANAQELRFSQQLPPNLNNNDVLKLVQAFPNIKSFSPHGNFSGKYFTEFNNLEELTLTHCVRRFRTKHFLNILEKFSLRTLRLGVFESLDVQNVDIPFRWIKSLEILKVDCDEMEWFIPYLSEMEQLKELALTYMRPYAFEQICSKLKLASRTDILLLECSNNQQCLRKLYDSGIRFDRLNVVTDSDLLTDSTKLMDFQNFKFLKQVCFYSCCLHDEEGLNNFIYNIPQVELLSIVECHFGFPIYEIHVKKLVERRTKQLTLNLKSNQYANNVEMCFQMVGESDLVNLRDDIETEIAFESLRVFFKTKDYK